MSNDNASCDRCNKDVMALQRLLAAVLAVSDSGIIVFDERGRFVMANPGFKSTYRWRSGTLAAESFASLFPDGKLPSSMIRLPRSVPAGGYETMLRGGDGALVSVRVNARWITHEDQDSYWVAGVTPAAGASASAGAAGAAACHPAGFHHAVRDRVRADSGDPFVMAGQVELTKLDHIRTAAGQEWPQVSAHIFSEAEAILTRRLSGTDAFTHDGEGRFTICFGEAALDEAERCTEAIEQDLHDRLTGEFGVSGAPEAQSYVDRITLAADDVAGTMDIGALVASRLAEKRALIEKMSAMTLARVIDAARLDLQPIVGQSGSPTALTMVRLDRPTSRAVDKIAAVSNNPGTITGQIDHLLLGLTAARIYEDASKEWSPTFIVPVSFSTFVNRRLADRYTALLRGLAPGVGQHLIFELVGVPEDVASMRIEDIVSCLRSYSRIQCLRLAGLGRSPSKPWERHFHHYTIRYADIDPTRRDSEALRPLVSALHQRRCRLGVQDVPDAAAARMLNEAGVDFLSGAGLPTGRDPAPASRAPATARPAYAPCQPAPT